MRRPRPAKVRNALAAAAVGLLVAATLVVGNEVQRSFNDDRYLEADAVIDELAERAPGDHRIGLAGVWTDHGLSPILPAFGPRFENEVEYIGPVVREMQERYESRDSFLRALGAGDYDYLIAGRGRPGVPPPEEGRWAASAGWERAALSERLVLYTPSAG